MILGSVDTYWCFQDLPKAVEEYAHRLVCFHCIIYV
jgi:hypothetical protein